MIRMRTVQECLRKAEEFRLAALEAASPKRRQPYVEMEQFWRRRADELKQGQQVTASAA